MLRTCRFLCSWHEQSRQIRVAECPYIWQGVSKTHGVLVLRQRLEPGPARP